jgi:predicted negative regulator of RcsB-dependent stress response
MDAAMRLRAGAQSGEQRDRQWAGQRRGRMARPSDGGPGVDRRHVPAARCHVIDSFSPAVVLPRAQLREHEHEPMSPKNKGKFGQGRSAVETTDEFVSGVSQVADKLRPHTKVIAWVTGALALVLVGFYTYQYLAQRAEAKATVIYRQALEIAERPIVPETDEAKPEAGGDAKDEAGAKDTAEAPAADDEAGDEQDDTSFPSHQARADAVLVPLEALREEHGSTATARTARLFHAAALYDAGRFQDAIAMYQEILAGETMPAIAATAREGLGYAQEALALANEDQAARQAGLETALATFRQIQPSEEGPRREYALYHEARILATLGKREDAAAILKKAIEIAPESPLRNDIRQRLAQLAE